MMEQQLKEFLDFFINESLGQIIFSNPVKKDGLKKVKLRPVVLRKELMFQVEELTEKQAFHKNLSVTESKAYAAGLLREDFRQMEVISALGSGHVLVSKKGKMTVRIKKAVQPQITAVSSSLSHNRKKHYIIEEGSKIPFLRDLGVITAEGKIVRSKYDKFRQINRFLEFIEDILPRLDKNKETTIIDFGCGKSYLTFAMYYYLKEMKGYPVHMIGLDLKKDVIEQCRKLAKVYGFDGLEFCQGDIAGFEGIRQVDLVVTLHACDTATDYALAKAVEWGASVILSVPCCQHELNGQIKNEVLAPVLEYGLIKERMSALLTDALRAEILEHRGYRTQILEFIDLEHTPKNILIRAVKEGRPKANQEKLEELTGFLHVAPTLMQLLGDR